MWFFTDYWFYWLSDLLIDLMESLLLSVTFSPIHFKRIALKYRIEERRRALLAKNNFSRSRRNADRRAEKARRNLSRVRPSARRDEKMFSSSVTRDCRARVSNRCFPSSRVRAWNDFARERTLSFSRAPTGRLCQYANISRRLWPRLLQTLGPLTKLGSILPTGQHLGFCLGERGERKNSSCDACRHPCAGATTHPPRYPRYTLISPSERTLAWKR